MGHPPPESTKNHQDQGDLDHNPERADGRVIEVVDNLGGTVLKHPKLRPAPCLDVAGLIFQLGSAQWPRSLNPLQQIGGNQKQ